MSFSKPVTALSDVKDLTVDEQTQLALLTIANGGDEVKEAIAKAFPGASAQATDKLWMIIIKSVMTCLVLAVIALVLMLYLAKPTEVVITVITSILTFIGGVFVKSPGNGG